MRSIAIALVLLWSAIAGAVPTTINFTGRLTTSTGPVNGAVNVTLALFADPSGGNPLWTEVHDNVGADNGLVFIDAGTLTKLDDTVLDGRRLYLEIVVGNETLAPRLALNSVPYAVRTDAAGTADLLGGSIGPGDVVTTVTSGAGISATRTGNAVTVGLTTTACRDGQVFKFSGGAFACADDAVGNFTAGNGLAISSGAISLKACAANQIYKMNAAGTAFACAADDNTSFTGTAPISVSNGTISLSAQGCGSGTALKSNGQGAFTCQADAVGTAGNGIAISSNSTISLSTASCSPNQVYKLNAAGTAFACSDVVAATAPLAVNAATATVSLSGCAANQILRWVNNAWVCSADFTATSCTWKFTSATGTAAVAACPSGKHPISGGCDAVGTGTVTDSRPGGPPGDGVDDSQVFNWTCEFSAPGSHAAYAFCCNTI